MNSDIYKKGISIVEIILASAIISLSVISISVVYGNFVILSVGNTEKVQAEFLLDEGVEAIKIMRDASWSRIASTTPGTKYYFIWSQNQWGATTTPSLVGDKFTRTFTTYSVHRDVSTFNILSSTSSGSLDTGTRKVDIAVSWSQKGATSSKSTTMYIFNLYE